MISLFIDTSSSTTILALYSDCQEKASIKEDNMRDVSANIMVLLDKLLDQAQIKLKSINKIFVVNGPGSFTGLRIGVTIAKTLAWSLKIPVVPVSSLEVLASTTFDSDYIVPYIDARRNYVFGAIYDKKLDTVIVDQYLHINSLLSYLNDNKTYSFVGEKDMGFSNVINSDVNISKIINKHKNDVGVNPHTLVPNYLKRTEAEEKLELHD